MNRVRHKGFTLVEMMMALLVMGVLLFVAVPGLGNLIKNNRLLTDVYAMRAALNSARSEALAQRTFVTFCRSDDGATCGGAWNEGYIAFTDNDGDGAVDNPSDPNGDEVFVARVVDSESLNIFYSNGVNRVRFDNQGYARGFNGTFTVCDDRGVNQVRGVIVTPGGIVRAADPNDMAADPNGPCGT